MSNQDRMNEPSKTLPLVPLRGLLAYPNLLLHIDVGREKSITALEHALENDKEFIVVAQRDSLTDNPHIEDMYGVGTVVLIKQIVRRPDSSVSVLVEGRSRALLLNVVEAGDMQFAEYVRFDPQPLNETPEYFVYMKRVKQAFQQYAQMKGDVPGELRQTVQGDTNAETLTDVIAANVIQDIRKKQQILETRDVLKRLDSLYEMLLWECDCLVLEQRLQETVHENIDRHQREYYLRERLRAIHAELGDDDGEIDEFEEKLNGSQMNEEARNRVGREIHRLSMMPTQSPESAISRNYIEYMLELPWAVKSETAIDILRAERVLEEDHYGLTKVKERILEYLAVRAMRGDEVGTILCLVGPPGVGKTSIARSVARSMKREFTRLSLGGLRDEAELRGHRRTYVGAMPGRIISSIKQLGCVNPVFLLDEIDKMTSDMRGDPASAMLEVLDPEQNSTFRDHFIEAPFDLSHVFFITTANTVESIPRPLLDRMEIIEVPSYTLEEKVQIAKRHLWPKQVERHGLKRSWVRLGDGVFRDVIDGYTREAGVRSLERELGAILRKTAVNRLKTDEADRKPVTVTSKRLHEYLGVRRYDHMKPLKAPEVGVLNGLAWTSVGGETLSVEASAMPGAGQVELTGHLGDVMKESARIAYSFLRSKSRAYGIPEDFHSKYDLHVHVPEGATPKDGPSAGVAMTCAMLSAITGAPAKQDVAMTGEITLRGRVLPIGGVKEKVLAAYRTGIREIILPTDNEKDLEEVPVDVRDQLKIVLVDRVEQAIDAVLLMEERA